MKKKICLLAALVICAAVVTSGTLAYFTSEEQIHNVITSDGVDIAIDEWQETADGLVPYPDEPVEVMPGVTISKIAEVRNLEAESYIRAKFEIVIKDAEGAVIEIAPETLESIVTVKVNGTDWQRKDGDADWWYYAEAAAEDAATAPLFTEVAFDGPNMTNEYQNCTVEVIVSAQAVQTANNGESALEAKGWPAE